jgi:thiamine biosynthesis lipoprotein ApbE
VIEASIGPRTWLAQASLEAVETNVHLLVTEDGALGAARASLAERLGEYDATCNAWEDESELAALNLSGGQKRRLSGLLFAAIVQALRVAEITDGAVTPTVGLNLRSLGYRRQSSRGQHLGAAIEAPTRPAADWRSIEVDPARRTVRLPPGAQLDLSATALSHLADQVAREVGSGTGCGVLVNVGGDIAVAGPPPAAGWAVRIRDPDAGSTAETVSILAGGLATSDLAGRSWRQGNADFGHIIDPSTGAPAVGRWRRASVAAASCLEANAASTAALVKGRRAVPWLQSLGLPALLADARGEEMRLNSWGRSEAALAG